MLVATFFFALMNVGVKYLSHIPAYEVVFFRAFVSLVVCYLLVRREGLNPWGNNKPLLILRGLAGTAALTMYFYTLQHMPLASAATIQYLSPIFTIIIAGILLHESAKPIQWLFFLASFAGVLCIKGFDARVTPTELIIGVSAAICSALAYNFIRKLKGQDHPLVVVFYFPLVTVPIIGSYTLIHWVTPEPSDWIVLALIGLTTTVAQIYMTKAYQLERASNVSNYNYLGVVLALLIGFFAFGESIGFLGLGGIALITLSVFMSSRYRAVSDEQRQ
ncbi:MAG: EamA/RhaT family transporter [Candidatus Zixiibacteriota bacterium]|nr:MAG: EamA/RhaT family transporter [candidate division Zixibacteria bacterium]